EENRNSAHDCDWLFKQITTHSAKRHLHAARVVGNARYEKSRSHFVKELHGVAHNLAKELVPNVGYHFVAHPIHAIRIAVRTETAHRHDRWDGQADQNDRIDSWAHVQDFEIRPQCHRVRSCSAEDDACHAGDDYGTERIERAECRTELAAKYKTRVVPLEATVQ